MASSELPDDRRERLRRHRGSSEDGETGVPDEARTERDDQDWLLGTAARHGGVPARRGGRPGRDEPVSDRGADVTGRRRLQSDDDVVEPPWPPRGRRRAVPDDDGPVPQHGPSDVNGAPRTNGAAGTNGNGHRRADGYAPEGLPPETFRPNGRPGDNGRNGHRNGNGSVDRNGNGRPPFEEPLPGRNGGYPVDGHPGNGNGRAADRYAPPESGPRPARHGRPAGEPPRSDAPRSATPFTDAARGGAFRPDDRGPNGPRPDGPPYDGGPDGYAGRNGHAAPPRRGAFTDAPGRSRPGPDAGGTGHHRAVGAPAPAPFVANGHAEGPYPPAAGAVAPPGRRRRAPEGDGPPAHAGGIGSEDPDDVDTTSLPTTRRPRGVRPGVEPAQDGPDTPDEVPRPRGRRRAREEAYAAPPDVEPDERDVGDDARPPAAREDGTDETDGPRVGKRSGPVGVGGKITALTSRRGRDTDGEKKPTSFWRELPLLIGVALVLTFLIQTFVAKVFVIPSGSMETTLNGCTGCDNDRVLVDKVTYNFTNIAPGDVVVFRGPDSWSNSEYELDQTSNPVVRGLQMAGSLIGFAPPDEKDFVKRVIAVGGQTVSCCDALNQVMVDGQPLDEPYIYYLPEAGPARQIPFGPITVPQGEMWMMGDSRNNSADSRAAGHGPVPEENVIGKVRLIVLPFDRFGGVEAINPQTTAQAAGTGDLPQGTALALGMMGTFPFALGRRRILSTRAETERFLPVARRRKLLRRRR